MSMKESKARLDNSRILPEFYWWEAADIKRIFAKVEAIGLENARIKLYPGLDANGYPDMHIGVVDKREAATKNGDDPDNFSHVCPPDCNGT